MTDLQTRINANWRAIEFELDAPVPSRLERVLRRLGVSSGTGRLVAATPALRRSWTAALFVVVMIGLLATGDDVGEITGMLVLAPLVPVLGVALAYGPTVDPVHELAVATPMRGIRLITIRALTVLAVAIGVIGSTALLVAESKLLAAAWLLPAFAATGLTLSLMTITSPRRAVATVASGWAVLVLTVQGATGEALDVFAPAGQAAAVLLIGLAGVIVTKRREGFDRVTA